MSNVFIFFFPDNKCNAYSRESACKIVNFAQKRWKCEHGWMELKTKGKQGWRESNIIWALLMKGCN